MEEQFIFRRAGLADFLPKMEAGQSLFDFFCNVDFEQWEHWEMVLPEWEVSMFSFPSVYLSAPVQEERVLVSIIFFFWCLHEQDS